MSEVKGDNVQGNSQLSEQLENLKSLAAVTDMSIDHMPEFKELEEAAKKGEPKDKGNSQAKRNQPNPAENNDPGDEDEEEEEERQDEGNDDEDEDEDPADKKNAGKSKTEAGKSGMKKDEKGKKTDPKGEEEEDEDEEEEEDLDDPRDAFGTLKRSSKKSKVPVKLDDTTQSFIEKKYSIKSGDKFFESVDKWRNDAQKKKEVEDELENIHQGLASLPPQLAAAIQLVAEGKDWSNAFTTNRIDFSKSFEKQEQETIVAYYFADKYKSLKNKYEKGDMEENDFNDRISDLFDSSKRLYDADKLSIENHRANMVRKAQEEEKTLKDSIVSSVENLKEKWPGFKPAQLQRVKQILANGNIESLFKDKNGRYKESAAKLIALAEYGESMIELLQEQAEKRGKNKAVEEYVHRANSKVPGKKNNNNQKDEAVANVVHSLDFAVKKDPYANVPQRK